MTSGKNKSGYFLPSMLCALLAIALMPTLSWAEPLYTNIESSRFRSGPGSSYKILWTSEKYTPLEYLAKYKDWYVVRDYEGDVAWVHKVAVEKGLAAIVTKKKANVRNKPSTSSDIVFTVEKGYPFKVVETKGSWYKVEDSQGDTGWVLDQLVWVSR